MLTIINASIGAYQGFHGMAWFQNGESNENVKENEFFIKDRWGKVLMSGGIEEAEARIEKQLDEEMAVVEIIDGRCQIAMDSLKEAESIAEKLNNTK